MNSLPFLYAVLTGYLLGSIPFGLLLTKFSGAGDIRKIGSGNIGATNVLRTGNKKLAALTLLLDGLKGTIAVLLIEKFFPGYGAMAALAALAGHLFPVWLKFKGGKGVATSIGVMLGLYWPIGLMMIAVWLLVAKLFKYSSLAALVAIGLMPTYPLLLGRQDLLGCAIIIALTICVTHRANIKRLLTGQEPHIGQG